MNWERSRILPASASLLCAIVTAYRQLYLEGTEFSGGTLTGQLLNLSDLGSSVFALAALLLLWRPRVGAALSVVGSLSCLPLYLYFLVPGVFYKVFPGQYTVRLTAVRWEPSSIVVIVLLALTLYLSYRRHSASTVNTTQSTGPPSPAA